MNWKEIFTMAALLAVLPLPLILMGAVYAELALWLMEVLQ